MAAADTCGAGTLSSRSVASEAGQGGTSSFQRKGKASGGPGGGPRLLSIAGTRPSVRNGQLLVSTGLPALDQLLGRFRINMWARSRRNLGEGLLGSPSPLCLELPAPLLDDNSKKELEDVHSAKTPEPNVNMKIAWRYQLQPKMEVGPVSSSRFGHYYDLSKRIPQELLQSSKWHGFFLPEHISPDLKGESCFLSCGYMRLLEFIQKSVYAEGFDGANPQKKQKNILRIGIQNLGSPLWGDDICCKENCDNNHRLTKFLYILRGLLRSSLSACIITMPAHLVQNKSITTRVRNLSDTVVGLESFIGSERETNPLYKDYHGLIHIRKIPRLNNLTCDESDVKDLAFKLKRKLFTIERLHLPPDLSDTVGRSSKQDLAASTARLGAGCSSMAEGKKHLDF
uniref:Elongator complex protein 4 n=1 Tax=Mus spicilegus TaxID=10103 RepID=A0A8C6MW42_MUSSI